MNFTYRLLLQGAKIKVITPQVIREGNTKDKHASMVNQSLKNKSGG